jgi:transposase
VVLFEDETILREFPPLRACWAVRGAQARVPITGSNARRTIFGALNPTTGTQLCRVHPRGGAADFRAFLAEVRGVYRRWNILMLLDQGSAHTATATRARATELRVALAFLPTACPELNPMELLWKAGKQHISANRAYDDIDEQALMFLDHLSAYSPADTLRLTGIQSSNFWLPT